MPQEDYVACRLRLAICCECHRDHCYQLQGEVVADGEWLRMRVACGNCDKRLVFSCITELESHNRRAA